MKARRKRTAGRKSVKPPNKTASCLLLPDELIRSRSAADRAFDNHQHRLARRQDFLDLLSYTVYDPERAVGLSLSLKECGRKHFISTGPADNHLSATLEKARAGNPQCSPIIRCHAVFDVSDGRMTNSQIQGSSVAFCGDFDQITHAGPCLKREHRPIARAVAEVITASDRSQGSAFTGENAGHRIVIAAG